MGTENAFLVISALHDSESTRSTLQEFYCNFNEITASAINLGVLQLLLEDFPVLQYVEYRGNYLPLTLKKDLTAKFLEVSKKLVLFEEDYEEGDDEDEAEDEEEDEEQAFGVDDVLKRLEQLKL